MSNLKIDHPELISGKIYVRLQKFLNEIDETTAEHVEQMAAAYFKQTDIPPSEVELVMEYGHLEVKWYFRRRE